MKTIFITGKLTSEFIYAGSYDDSTNLDMTNIDVLNAMINDIKTNITHENMRGINVTIMDHDVVKLGE